MSLVRDSIRFNATKYRPVGTRGEESYTVAVYVDPHSIIGVSEYDREKSCLLLAHGHSFLVDEPIHTVLNRIYRYGEQN